MLTTIKIENKKGLRYYYNTNVTVRTCPLSRCVHNLYYSYDRTKYRTGPEVSLYRVDRCRSSFQPNRSDGPKINTWNKSVNITRKLLMIESSAIRKLLKTQFNGSRTIFNKQIIIRLHINEPKDNIKFKFNKLYSLLNILFNRIYYTYCL